jgi:hypothetical protein
MSRLFRRKWLVALSVVGVLAVAGAAIAYFTSSGSGTGTASVGSSSPVTIHGTAGTTLYPGTNSSVSFTVDNPSSGTEHVGTIHLGSVTTDAGHSTCDTTAFTMPDVNANQTFPNGSGQSVTATGTLTMADTGVSQDGCQGAPLTLHLTSN